MELPDQGRQIDKRCQALNRPDPQLAALQALNSRHRLTGVARRGQHTPRLANQCPARGGHLDPARAALEQGRSQLLLERADRGRQPRLHDVETTRGAREVLLLRHRYDVLELPEIHGD